MKTLIFTLLISSTAFAGRSPTCADVAKMQVIQIKNRFHDKSQKVVDAVSKAIEKMNEDIIKKREACGLNAQNTDKPTRKPASAN